MAIGSTTDGIKDQPFKSKNNLKTERRVYTLLKQMSTLWTLVVPVLGVVFGARQTWIGKPHAEVQVVAKGHVSPELVRLHVIELKETAILLLKSRCITPDDIDADSLSVDIKRTQLSGDEEACINTSIVMSMTAGAMTVMH